MRLKQFIIEQTHSFKNWKFPDKKTILADFTEYKKKEDKKWRGRANMIGARFPIFEDLNHFQQSLKNAKVVTLDSTLDNTISNRSQTNSLEDLKNLVSSYYKPRDVDRIVNGYNNNDPMPMPIVIEGRKGRWIMAGNTRLDTAFIMGVKPKVLWVNVGE